MTGGRGPVPRSATLRAAQEQLELSLGEVWMAYFSVGGNAGLPEVEAWLSGAAEPNDHDHDLMAQSLNDRFSERGHDHPVPYADALS